jgi:phage repressor protein C with HTH and peptisase S24 domain
MDIVRDLIKKRLEETRLSMSAASLRIGRNASYLQQFLRRGVPDELHERERLRLAELLGIDENDLRGTSTPLTSRPYTKNGDTSQTQASPDISVAGPEQKSVSRLYPVDAVFDLPVFATTQVAGGGASMMNRKVVDRISRPNFLMHVADAYGIIIGDNAMSPEIKNGATVLVHPHLPAHDGDTCVFRSERDTSSDNVEVRVLVRSTDHVWHVHRHKPKPKTYTLKKSDWPLCHLVVGVFFSRR